MEKIKEIVRKSPNCFFCTAAVAGASSGARPMKVRWVDDEGSLWFLSASDSRKNRELDMDPAVTLFFQGSPQEEFLHLCGRATISRDRAKIEELWEPVLRSWLTDGRHDPRITVIKVTPTHGHYWDSGHRAAVEIFLGSAIRTRMADAVEAGALV
ncbi:MAG TPA: pyridoxamine 5'-phosphate oxidase family protein [Candidatus Polarisedimenticolaceae bacterium]|nr:pyridoxamine 5'-phosphate oxidase family protein [Candidatus Polarisedimenticolaceae bacterium]